MRLKKYISEMAVLSNRKDWLYTEVLDDLKKMDKSDPLMWRGWNGGKNFHATGWMVKVGSQREGGYKGKMLPVVRQILAALKIDSPVFATMSHSQATFFGTPYALVPIGSYKVSYNALINDLAGAGQEKSSVVGDYDQEALQAVINDYKTLNNDIPKDNDGEVLLTVDKYWLISANMFIRETKGNFRIYQNVNEIKTYGDLINLIENYLKYYKWFIGKRMEENPNRMKEYSAMGVPKEWLE